VRVFAFLSRESLSKTFRKVGLSRSGRDWRGLSSMLVNIRYFERAIWPRAVGWPRVEHTHRVERVDLNGSLSVASIADTWASCSAL